MVKFPKAQTGSRRWSDARRFRGWVASWLQDRRRGRRPVPGESAVPPLGNLRLWLAPDFLTELPGEDVLYWPDLSAQSNDLGEHTTVVVYPVRSDSEYNGYAGVKFARRDLEWNDTIGALQSNAPVWSGAEARSLYVVYALNDVEGYGYFDYDFGQYYMAAIAGQMTPIVNQSWILMERPDVGPGQMPYLAGWASDFGFGNSQEFDAPRLATVTYDGTNGRGYVNCILNATSAKSYNTAPLELSVGVLNDGQYPLFGDVLELLAYGEVHNSTTRAAIESYLMNKYGITP